MPLLAYSLLGKQNIRRALPGQFKYEDLSFGFFRSNRIGSAMPSASHNAANQLTGWNESALSYDQNGNVLSDGLHAYSWDARNHVSTSDSGSTGSFV